LSSTVEESMGQMLHQFQPGGEQSGRDEDEAGDETLEAPLAH
jgi:hypothetical protein